MKRILFVLTLMLTTVLSGFAQGKSYNVVGIAFYNLENLFDTINNNGKYDMEFSPEGDRKWDGYKYWNKIHNMAYALSSFKTKTTPYGPAVIGVSEIENITVLQDLVADPQLKPWNLQIVHHDSPDRRGVDVGLLYNPLFFKVENVTNHTLTLESNPNFRTRDVMCVVGNLMGCQMAVLVNHFPSRLGGETESSYLREAAAALNVQICDSLWNVNPDLGVVIMGDMNDDPQNKSMAKVIGAQKKPDKVGPHQFYNPFWAILDSGVGTLAYKGAWNLFDQIVISGNLVHTPENKFHYWRASVHNFDFLIDKQGTRQGYPLRTFSGGAWLNGYSDHFPTEIFLRRVVNVE